MNYTIACLVKNRSYKVNDNLNGMCRNIYHPKYSTRGIVVASFPHGNGQSGIDIDNLEQYSNNEWKDFEFLKRDDSESRYYSLCLINLALKGELPQPGYNHGWYSVQEGNYEFHFHGDYSDFLIIGCAEESVWYKETKHGYYFSSSAECFYKPRELPSGVYTAHLSEKGFEFTELS